MSNFIILAGFVWIGSHYGIGAALVMGLVCYLGYVMRPQGDI